ncbi:hypothetical protein WJX73_004823 [Symbiochloris irregularis]|uniref:Coiled-coil domain-containing protein 6 n=1 Tax=Symbiochloris irregularis TaxID=706552 RepID=A0AAW1NVM5_9CHLO
MAEPEGGTSFQALAEELSRTKDQLDLERRRSSGFAAELRAAKEHQIQIQKQVEMEEEYITNKLMKRLEQLKNEKQSLANEVEQEEEYLINNLQKRLQKLNSEKVELERQLEAEQEYVVNKLQKKLDELRLQQTKLNYEKVDLENQLEAEQEYIVNKLQKQLERLVKEKGSLQKEKCELQRQVTDLAASSERLHREHVVMIKSQMEVEEENIVNRLQRQIETLLASYKALEAALEARGISIKDLTGPLVVDRATEWVYGRSPSKGNSSDALRRSSEFANARRLRSYSAGSSSCGERSAQMSPEPSQSLGTHTASLDAGRASPRTASSLRQQLPAAQPT